VFEVQLYHLPSADFKANTIIPHQSIPHQTRGVIDQIYADVNGAYNILRKSKPDTFAKGTAGYVVHPIWLAIAV